jgi:hypothetical protein
VHRPRDSELRHASRCQAGYVASLFRPAAEEKWAKPQRVVAEAPWRSLMWATCSCPIPTRELGILRSSSFTANRATRTIGCGRYRTLPTHTESSPSTCVDTVGQARPIMATTPEHSPTTLPVCRISSDAVPWSRFGDSLGGVVASALAVERASLVPGRISAKDRSTSRGPACRPRCDRPDDARRGLVHAGLAAEFEIVASAANCWHVSARPSRSGYHALFGGPQALIYRWVSEDFLRERRCPVLAFCAAPARAELEATLFTDPGRKLWRGMGRATGCPRNGLPSSTLSSRGGYRHWVCPLLDGEGAIEGNRETNYSSRSFGSLFIRWCSDSNRQCGHPPGRLRPLRSRRYGWII